MDHQDLRELKILIIDASDVLRKSLVKAFGTLVGLEVIGEAATGEEGVKAARSLRPDLIVFEPSADTSGLEALHEIRRHDLRVLIVIFTADYSPAFRGICRNAGATFFVSKSRIRDLLDAAEIARKLS